MTRERRHTIAMSAGSAAFNDGAQGSERRRGVDLETTRKL
jgi:hypothetical protein